MAIVMFLAATAFVSSPVPRSSMTPSQREIAIWDTVKRGDSVAYGAMLAPSYVGVYTDGVFNKAAEVASIHNDHLSKVKLSNFTIHMLNPRDMLVTYAADVEGTSSGKNVSGRYWESSTWHRYRGTWLGTFHMEVKATR